MMTLPIFRRCLPVVVAGWLVIAFSAIGESALAGSKPVPAAPSVAARAYLMVEPKSGQILSESNINELAEPASLTKMMAAYVVFDELRSGNISLDDDVLISEKAWKMPGSRTFVEVGKKVSVEVLLKGMIIQSGNDATVALAEHVAGGEDSFASLMNHHAELLGMTNSRFVNATGLPAPEHRTSARDLARLADALVTEFPKYYEWFSIREFRYNEITQYNRNKLLWRDDTVDGAKTGHTESAGYCLVTTAKKGDMRLITVILGAKSEESRAQESRKLLNYGFRFFETHRLYEALKPLAKTRVWKGSQENLQLGLDEDLYVTIPRGEYDNIKAEMRFQEMIMAPVSDGQVVGEVDVSLGEKTLAKPSLVALGEITEGGVLNQVKDEFLLLFE